MRRQKPGLIHVLASCFAGSFHLLGTCSSWYSSYSLGISSSIALLEQVRQCLQCNLATPILPHAAHRADAQVWQIGPTLRLLAIPAPNPGSVLLVPRPGAGPGEAGCCTLFVYEYVSTKLGAQLRAQGTYYADAVGNAWMQHPQLLVSMQGRTRPRQATQPVPSSASQVNLLRLLFQLLVEPGLAMRSLAGLAAHTRLPVAAVRRALHELAALGLWQGEPLPGSSSLRVPEAARYWLSHYAKTLRPRLNPYRYRFRNPAAPTDWLRRPLPANCLWSGEAATQLLLGQPEPPASLVLYSQTPRSRLVQQLDLVPYTHGNVEILNAFAPPSFLATAPRCVPPLLVYADLLATQQPANEARAQEIQGCYLGALLG